MPINGIQASGGMKPTPPTIGTASDGGTGTTVSVAFTPSSYIGKGTIQYTATSNPGNLTASGSGSPLVVTGLTSGTSYTFTVRGNTNYGVVSDSSAASNSVIPLVPGSFDSIASATPTGTSTMTFSSIPNTYRHLQIRINALHTVSDFGLLMRINNDATSGNYNESYLRGTGSGVQANYSGGNQDSMAVLPSQVSATNPSVSIIEIQDYQSTTKTKTVRGWYGNDRNGAGGAVGLTNGLYKPLTAVSSITLFTSGSTQFTTGTVISLYGIKG